MSPKTLRAVVGALVGLVLLYALVRVVGMRGEPVSEGGEELALALEAIVPAEITSLRLVSAVDSIQLDRAGGVWSVNGFRADTIPVTRLLTALDESEVTGLVASNPGNHERLGVAGAEARTLLAGGAGPVELIVGHVGPGAASTYVRLPGSDEVFSVRGDLRSAISRSVEQWRDRTVVRADTAAVSRVIIERGSDRTELVRGDSTWTANGTAVQALEVRDLLGGLAALIGVGFAPDSVDVDPVERRVTALGAAGDTLAAIAIGAEHEPGNVPARAPGVEGVVELSTFQADRITPTRETLAGG